MPKPGNVNNDQGLSNSRIIACYTYQPLRAVNYRSAIPVGHIERGVP